MWSDDECAAFIEFIAAHPLAGAVVEGTGGVRKIRWAREGMGKRGGVRVIYYYLDEAMPVFLISIFAKNVRADMSAAEKAQARQFVQALKRRRKDVR